MNNYSKLSLIFGIHLFFNLIVLPFILSQGFSETFEAYYLGMEWQLGYYKHPPLLNWITALGFAIMPNSFVFFILPQILVCFILLYAYKLAREFFNTEKSIIAILLLSFFPPFSIYSFVFNQDSLIVLMFIASIYYYYKFLQKNTFLYAIAFGLFVGFGLMTKYFFIIPVVCFLIHSLIFAKQYKNIKLYLAGLVCVLIFLPHFYWLLKNDFLTLKYTTQVISQNKNGLMQGLRLTLEQLLYIALTIIVTAIIMKQKPQFNNLKKLQFIKFFLFASILILLLFTTFTGVEARSRFLWQFYTLFPIYALSLFGEISKKRFLNVFSILISLLVIIYTAGMMTMINQKKNENIDYKDLSIKIEKDWRQACGEKPIQYIISNKHWSLTSVLVVYFKNPVPHFVPHGNFGNVPYLDEKDYKKNGGIIVDRVQPKEEKTFKPQEKPNYYVYKISNKKRGIFFEKPIENLFEVEINCGEK
jgi:hypothetical protein